MSHTVHWIALYYLVLRTCGGETNRGEANFWRQEIRQHGGRIRSSRLKVLVKPRQVVLCIPRAVDDSSKAQDELDERSRLHALNQLARYTLLEAGDEVVRQRWEEELHLRVFVQNVHGNGSCGTSNIHSIRQEKEWTSRANESCSTSVAFGDVQWNDLQVLKRHYSDSKPKIKETSQS